MYRGLVKVSIIDKKGGRLDIEFKESEISIRP